MEKFKEKIDTKKIKQPEIQPPEFEIEEFEKARESFENLTKKLTPAIRRHEYNLIIGDDVSGRLPTRIVGDLLRKVYKEDKITVPEIRFFAGGLREEGEIEDVVKGISDYIRGSISKNKIDPSKTKVLLTTEYMAKGRTMSYFIRALRENGLSSDIAALNLYRPRDFFREDKPSDFKDVKIYHGGIATSSPFFHRLISTSKLAGVAKESGKIFTVPLKKDKDLSGLKQQSREDVKKMADYLYQIYEQEKEKIEK